MGKVIAERRYREFKVEPKKSIFIKKDNSTVTYQIHTPLSNWINNHEINNWVNGIANLPYADANNFWKLYGLMADVLTDDSKEYVLSQVEKHERKNFLNNDYITAKIDNNIIGGLWIERYKNEELFHIFSSPKIRLGIANDLEALMISERLIKGVYAVCNWPNSRNEKQIEFFKKKGYTVSLCGNIYSAVKKIN